MIGQGLRAGLALCFDALAARLIGLLLAPRLQYVLDEFSAPRMGHLIAIAPVGDKFTQLLKRKRLWNVVLGNVL